MVINLFLKNKSLDGADPDMQIDNFFTQTWFEAKTFYPKKCVNYGKSNS